jgi:carbamoyl-phosphate synthase large subunit
MKSTGEVMGVADNFGEAFYKAQLSAGQKLPTQGTVFISVNDQDKPHVAEVAKRFFELGFKLVATHGTADLIEGSGLPVDRVYKVKEGRPSPSTSSKPTTSIDREHARPIRTSTRRRSAVPQ